MFLVIFPTVIVTESISWNVPSVTVRVKTSFPGSSGVVNVVRADLESSSMTGVPES